LAEGKREHVVTVGRCKDAPALVVDGEVMPFTSFKINENPKLDIVLDAADAEIPGIARQGVNIIWVPVFVDWSGPSQYDFTGIDERVNRILKHLDANLPEGAAPGMLVIRLQAAIFRPDWYVDAHRDGDGQPTNLIEFRNPQGRVVGYYGTDAVSVGDSFWDTHAVDCLRACVRHVRQSAYADRVIGYLPCAFNSNEWFIRAECPGATHDFSRPTQDAFARHLKELRGIDVADPVPSPADCIRVGRGEFVETDSKKGPFVEEYAAWVSDRMADIILKWTRAVREECGEYRKLVGYFYGYGSELSFATQYQQCAHLALGRLLDSDEVDFFCSPCQYMFRADEGAVTYNSVLGAFADSAGLRGKLTFAEDDHRPPKTPSSNAFLVTRDRWHDEMFFLRNFVQVMTHGQQQWWYSLGARWLDEDWRQQIVGRLHRLGIESMGRDRSPAAEVAVVFDERSPLAMRINPEFQSSLIMRSFAQSFHPVGAPIEFHELHSFLEHADHDRFRVVAFLDLFVADDEVMAAIEKLKGGGRTLLFQFAPGFVSGQAGARRFSADRSSQLVGMQLEEQTAEMPLTVWIDPDSHEFFADMDDTRYGCVDALDERRPVLAAVDPKAEQLGRLHNGLSGLAIREHADWSSVFSAAPLMPGAVVQRLLKRAGVHVYTEGGDVIYANRSYLGVSACSRGVKTIRLPDARVVRDAFTGEEVALDADASFSITMRRHEVRIFRLDDRT